MKNLFLFLISVFIFQFGNAQAGLGQTSKEIRKLVRKKELIDSMGSFLKIYEIYSKDSLVDGYIKTYFILDDTCFMINVRANNIYSEITFQAYLRNNFTVESTEKPFIVKTVYHNRLVFIEQEYLKSERTLSYSIYFAVRSL